MILGYDYHTKKPYKVNTKILNRHGLITGQSGTGKTASLHSFAESMSKQGIPVFLADIKGDLVNMHKPSNKPEGVVKFLKSEGLPDIVPQSNLVKYYSVFSDDTRVKISTTIQDIGPDLLAQIMGLTQVQASILDICFRIANDNAQVLLDLNDLRNILHYITDNRQELRYDYGLISTASIGAIIRGIIRLENSGVNELLASLPFNVFNFIKINDDGTGLINILDCVRLVKSPILYATFLLWLLSSIYDKLPERGNREKPLFCFFFDEAHLLFKDKSKTGKALIDKLENIVRLIRSKGVGVYFVTQKPSDIPEDILGQLANKILHGLSATTGKDTRAVRDAANGLPFNNKYNLENELKNLGTGQALVSFLDDKGKPRQTEKLYIKFADSYVGA